MSPFVFFRLMECQRLLRGNACAWIYRNGYGEPVELIPLPPSTCEPVIEPGTGRLWYLAAEPKSGRMYKLSPADILHFKAYSPDGIKGVSVLRRPGRPWRSPRRPSGTSRPCMRTAAGPAVY